MLLTGGTWEGDAGFGSFHRKPASNWTASNIDSEQMKSNLKERRSDLPARDAFTNPTSAKTAISEPG